MYRFSLLLITLICQYLSTEAQNPQIPNIFDIKDKRGGKTVGYKIIWEVSDVTGINTTTKMNIGSSYSVTEYYDIVNSRGRLDIVRGNGVNGTFIYDGKTGETFHLNEGTCSLGNVNKQPDFLKKILANYNMTTGFKRDLILGPSVYLRMLYLNPDKVTYQNFNSFDKRYSKGNLWNSQVIANNIMGWVFTDPSSPNPYGFQNMAIPIWVSIGSFEGPQQQLHQHKIYEVAQFTPFTNTTKKIISIPLGVGCGRSPSAIVNAPKPPVLKSGFSYDMKLEIVMNPRYIRTGNDVNPSNLVDNGRLTYDDVSKMMAWRYDGFNITGSITNKYFTEEHKAYKDTGFYYEDVTIDTGNNNVIIDNGPLKGNELKNPTRTVWDYNSGVVYVIDDVNGGCTVKQKAVNDFLVAINFKSGYRIPINAPELLQNGGFVYMGEFVERGIPVVVYERKLNKTVGYGKNVLNKTVVFTHYFVKDNYSNSYIANNMLLRIDISILNPYNINGVVAYTKIWSVTINVNEFTIKLQPIDNWAHIKQKVFNVKNCYLKKGLSKWFQLGFPITNKQYIKLFQQANTIDRQILSYLFTSDDLSIPPTRIPSSLIGWKQNTLYFSALMLERAPFSLDFHVISVGPQRLKKHLKQVLVQSLQDCYGRCLDLDTKCNYLSICSNFMCILDDGSLDRSQKPEMVKSINCTTYQKNTKSSMLTMNRILTKIQNKTQSKSNNAVPIRPLSFTLYLVNSSGLLETMTLTAVQFKSGFSLGQTNSLTTNDGQIMLNNNRYKLRSVNHYKMSSNDKRLTLVQATSYLNCQQKCDDFHNNTCHSFSFCTTNQECILSTFHAEQLIDSTYNKTYEQKSDCALLYRYYITDYTRIGSGVITTRTTAKALNVRNEEECAFACSNETSFKCKSFDTCGSGEGPPIKNNCFLHRVHNVPTKVNESIQLTLDRNYVHCGHYSRNYASDFNVRSKMNYAYVDGRNRIKMTGLTVEQCAKQCIETQSQRKCLGFSYCQGRLINSLKPQPICLLSPTNDQNNTVYYKSDPQCEIYFNGALRFRLIVGAQSSPSHNSSKKYSSSAGAGLGIFMLLLGGALAVVAIIVYNKRKAALNHV